MAGRIKPWGMSRRDDAVRGFLLGGFLAVGGYVHQMHSSGWGSDGFTPMEGALTVLIPTMLAVIGGYLIRRFPERHRRLKAALFPGDGRVASELRAESDRLAAWWRGVVQRWKPRR